MSKKNNATCSICGKGYTMCRSCDRDKPDMVWKLHCDCPEHYKIFQVIHGYTAGVYTGAEAAKKLERIDLSDFDELRDSVKVTINKIRNEAKPKVKVATKTEVAPVMPVTEVKSAAKVARRTSVVAPEANV